MLISARELSRVYGVNPMGVLHVGAHEGEEHQAYFEQNWGHVYWVEANPILAQKLRTKFEGSSHRVIEAAAWSISGVKLNFNIASNGLSSSLLEFGTHKFDYPEIRIDNKIETITRRLDEVIPNNCEADLLTLDIQGAELNAIVGLGSRLSQFKWVFTEVNKQEVYTGCAKVTELDEYLRNCGFKRVATRWEVGKGWGDALYSRDQHNNAWRIVLRIKSFITFYAPRYFSYSGYVCRGLMRRVKRKIKNSSG